MSKKIDKQEQEEARTNLLKHLKPGKTVYTILRHRAKSNMSRRISLVIVDETDGRIFDITWWAAQVLGGKVNSDDGGITVSGCGMDMGFHLAYRLGYCLWPDGTPEPHGNRNGEPNSNGGYALKQQWL